MIVVANFAASARTSTRCENMADSEAIAQFVGVTGSTPEQAAVRLTA